MHAELELEEEVADTRELVIVRERMWKEAGVACREFGAASREF